MPQHGKPPGLEQPDEGDVVIRPTSDGADANYVIGTVSSPASVRLKSRNEAIAHAVEFARNARVRAWIDGTDREPALLRSFRQRDAETAPVPGRTPIRLPRHGGVARSPALTRWRTLRRASHRSVAPVDCFLGAGTGAGNQYVNCVTGQMYVWVDETDAGPIANSIYNNDSGFTHDYYSGTTALASDPLRCLGITPAAWATGGPVSLPGELPVVSPEERIQAIHVMLRQLVDAGTLRSSWSRPLEVHLDHAARALASGDTRTELELLFVFRRKLQLLQDKDRLPITAAEALIALTDAVIENLQGLAL
jgi:hypothetical protein